MHSARNNENTPASLVAISQSLGGPRTKPADRSLSPSPSPAPIRKSRPFQSINPNQISRRVIGDDKENQQAINITHQRPCGVRIDQAAVILQPPTHFNFASEAPQCHSIHHPQPMIHQPQPLISKPCAHQVQLGSFPLSNQWATHQNYTHGDQSHPNNFPTYARGENQTGGPEVDPFAQLSARTLALMDQPESEVTIYDCEYCDKTYQGKHARSIWRRHLSDKHKIPLSTQPRRTRWDNDANRPKTEEERRERTLESKRRWARKNRAAKKAARDGQRNSIDQSVGNLSESMTSESFRASQDMSRAPSPFSVYSGQLARSQSTQVEQRGQMSGMTRGSSVPHTLSSYPSMGHRASLPFGNASYNPSFSFSSAPAPEWAFPVPPSQGLTPYSFESMTPNDFHDFASLTQVETYGYEGHVKRPRLSQSSSTTSVSAHDEEVDSELGAIGAIAEERPSSGDAQDGLHPMHFENRVDEGPVRPTTSGTLSSMSRPATSGTISSISHESEVDRVVPMNRAATEPQFAARYDLQTPSRELRFRSAGSLQLAHSPICRADAHCHDAADLLNLPAVNRADSNASLYQEHYAPMSTGKRVASDTMAIQPFGTSGPMSVGDWNGHVLDTPSGFSRFPFSNALSSPAGGTGLFGSPNSNLSKSLGLSLNSSVPGEDCLGGLLGGTASSWDMIHQRTS